MEGTDAAITVEEIQEVISGFIQTRLQAKLDKLKDDQHDEHERLLAAHEPPIWLADAARRVLQIQQVTHAIKYIHPDARGTNLFSSGNPQASDKYVGTHVLGDLLLPDVVGNAAALDVYKFLRLEAGGRTLLSLALASHPALRNALSPDAGQADEWIQAFASLVEAKGKPASHTLAKQLYWPMGEGQYHLLAPLFPSSLVSTVWRTLREHRFSDEAKAARDARRDKVFSPRGYYEYPNVVVQKFGGTKPQNISQLNSERYGENHLLPSLPPTWTSAEVRPPLFTESVFVRGFASRRSVGEAMNDLRSYLQRVEGINNKPLRDGRARRVQVVFDELLQYAGELWSLEPGWSAGPDCRLNEDEQCWLDPDRALMDEEFAGRCRQIDWHDNVCRRFANWFNARLSRGERGLPVGENEALEWRRLVDRELALLQKELRYD
ncbi:type I-F CRISPR-associated protein Csy1 [Halopseudomonas sp.]|uniref:type I-F CRISPR-associated protein Csy1 n=1 Tax=Halopseudomonas sp. TaxID=2901191 RepID=UPI00300379C9|tara:strand:- start:8102 stop:9409 length:1308 start_codon:yes stop_codon:yes gene_type:complete